MTISPRPVLMLTLLVIGLWAGLLLATGCGGGGGPSDERIAGIIHNLLLAAGTEGAASLESFPGSLPDDIPAEPPLYPGAELLVSNRQPAPFTEVDATATGLPPPLPYFLVPQTAVPRSGGVAFPGVAVDHAPCQVILVREAAQAVGE